MRIFYKILPWLFRIAILTMAYFCFDDYLSYNKAISQTQKKISYTYLTKERAASGKNSNYKITILYKNIPYQVDINQKIYEDVGKGKLPDLYYLSLKNRVFTPWEINYKLRLTIVAIVFFCCTFIPMQKIEDKILGKK
jgi:hypothetical protein